MENKTFSTDSESNKGYILPIVACMLLMLLVLAVLHATTLLQAITAMKMF